MKRTLDILIVLLFLPLWGSLAFIISLCVLVRMGRPIFFVQERPGRDERPFHLIKFRTMREGQGTDVERMTGLGRFLRRMSLDELPELINVLKGDMSLVGPRPLLMRYLPRYTPEERRRHTVRPGLTGWAQVNGRNAISWEQKFAYDLWYVDHWSLWLDFRILVRTAWLVLTGQGLNASEEQTMPELREPPLPPLVASPP